jgi:isopenicillin-N epimerase
MPQESTMRFGREALGEWPLDPAVTYLNHGTVGVTPRRVLAAQSAIRDDIERQPSRFLLRELAEAGLPNTRPGHRPRLRIAAAAVADFLGARGEDLVFVDNATTGAGAVLRSFPLEEGDEILVSDLGYGGVGRAAVFAARLRGATVRTVNVPYPFHADGITNAFADAVSPTTRLAIVDHVTAESALVLPLAQIARRLKAKGVAVLADGAHAPGAIPVNIPELGVDWYAGNLHKWAWVPRSSGILWAAPDRQADLHPLVTSWGLDRGFTAEFDLPGTRDPSSHLAAPAAIALLHEWGLDAIRRYNHELAWTGARYLADFWDTEFDVEEAMIGTMATVPVPFALGTSAEEAQQLRDFLLDDRHIEVQVHAWRSQIFVRISAQIYNDMRNVELLGKAVADRVASLR